MTYTKEAIKAVTFVRDAIRCPQDVRHFGYWSPRLHGPATINGKEIARSNPALKVKEVGRGVLRSRPVLRARRRRHVRLEATDKTTHCPLKGDTTYFDLNLDGSQQQDAAWSYTQTIDDAGVLKDLIAFDNTCVQIVEHTAS